MSAKILIIDDDEEMCVELKEILTDEGYDVCVALDGRQGLDLLGKDSYGVVILDLKLPEVSGYEILKAAKSQALCPKIIVLSGRPLGKVSLPTGSDHQEEEARVLGLAEIVLNKPVHVPDLIEKVHQFF